MAAIGAVEKSVNRNVTGLGYEVFVKAWTLECQVAPGCNGYVPLAGIYREKVRAISLIKKAEYRGDVSVIRVRGYCAQAFPLKGKVWPVRDQCIPLVDAGRQELRPMRCVEEAECCSGVVRQRR